MNECHNGIAAMELNDYFKNLGNLINLSNRAIFVFLINENQVSKVSWRFHYRLEKF